MISARPLYQGVRRSVWDPATSRERIGDWGGPGRSGPSCVLPKGVPQGQPESGVICWCPSAQRRCDPQGVVLSLSLSLSGKQTAREKVGGKKTLSTPYQQSVVKPWLQYLESAVNHLELCIQVQNERGLAGFDCILFASF